MTSVLSKMGGEIVLIILNDMDDTAYLPISDLYAYFHANFCVEIEQRGHFFVKGGGWYIIFFDNGTSTTLRM